MSVEANNSASNAQGVFVYMGQGSVVPRDVTRVRVHPSVRVIAARAFQFRVELVEVELSEGLEEIGVGAFQGCKSLKRIAISSSVRIIDRAAFYGCHELVEVELSEGLQEIGNAAFKGCKSLKGITIPSSLRRIARATFAWCEGLVEVELCEGLQEIGITAFCNCNSLKRITIPSTVRVIARQAFRGCRGLVKVELCERPQEIGGEAFNKCKSLRDIAIPPKCQVEDDLFDEADALKKAFPSKNSSVISEVLKHRFDRLPIHQLCYHQQYHPPNDMLRHLKEAMGTPEQPNITGTQQDCLGMTPLHILAGSTKHTMDLYQSLIEKYPNNLITQDKWGDLPILYAFWGNAPRGVVQMLVEIHKSSFPDHSLDWESMIVTLGEANAPDGIQNLFDTQQIHFSDQTINWEECAVELARLESPSTETFQLLLRLSVANRLDALGVGKWRNKVENLINECPDDRNARERQARLLYSNLTTCEQLKEATWLLELALWKAKIDDSASNIRVLSDEERYQCRINCGVQQILPIVVSFLLPTWDSNLRDKLFLLSLLGSE